MQYHTFTKALLLFAGMQGLAAGEGGMAADSLEVWLNRSNAVYSPHEAAQWGSVEQLKAAVAAEPTQINAPDENGYTPLHLAAQRGAADLVQVLLQAGADVLAKDTLGRTAVAFADDAAVKGLLKAAEVMRARELQLCRDIEAGQVDKVRAALAAGANPDALNADNSATMLSVAVCYPSVEVVQALLRAGANAHAVTMQNKSVLHVAALFAKEPMIEVLLAAGADPLHPGNNGATPLHDAVWCGNAAAVRALLPSYASVGYCPDGKRNGYPICLAIACGRANCLQLFLNAGVNVNDARFAGEPLLHMATKRDSLLMVKMLLEAGADKTARDAAGKTAADYAKGKVAELLK
ncbi:MAG: hypothetical protein E7033_05990 [Akkermansiaceae bacterium]|nr:hypothetical protein [Akkermansiaceae bacterium]